MDADTKLALEDTADAVMKTALAPDSAADVLRFRTVLTDGVCRITDVIADLTNLPCVGYVKTDLGETFPVFEWARREIARVFIGRRVKLYLDTSAKGTRYFTGLAVLPVDTSAPAWVCAKCGGVAKVRTSGDGAGRYCCTRCAYQMEAKP